MTADCPDPKGLGQSLFLRGKTVKIKTMKTQNPAAR
jgi:hypothetical protein